MPATKSSIRRSLRPLTFTAMRKNYNDAITVPVEVSSTQDGLFTVSEIKFEAGQEATTFLGGLPRS